MCSCNSDTETTAHFLLQCRNYNTERQTLFDKIATIDANILKENENNLINILLFGKPNSDDCFNKQVLNASIEFILSTRRFDIPLF